MSISFKQSQFELFPGTQGVQVEADKPRFFFAHLTLSIENLVVASIVILMLSILSFSIGVERGKRVTIARYKEYQSRMAPNMMPAAVNTPSPAANKMETKKILAPNAVVISMQTKAAAPAAGTAGPDKKTLQSSPSVVYSSPDSAKPYTIQVASFKKEEYANQEASLLKQKGYEIFVLAKGEHSIVCVGKFLLQKEAESFSAKLKKQYRDCLVRRF